MRKNIVYFILFIFISVLFSCDFQIPTAVEIKGNPDIRLAASKDIGAAFSDIIDLDAGHDSEMIECINTEIRTYMLYKPFSVNPSAYPPGTGVVTVPSDHSLGSNLAEISVDFGTIINDFTLKPAVARVFVYGDNNLLNHLKVDITVTYDDEGGSAVTEQSNKFIKGESGVSSPYYGTSIPGPSSTSANINLPLDAANLKVEFEVILEPGNYNSAWFSNGLSSEIIVWVPLVFTADSDNAEIVIPRDILFPADEDLFGRKAGDSNPLGDYVESLELSFILKKNLFDGKNLLITSIGDGSTAGKIEIEHKLRGNDFSFPIDKNNMKKLNDPSTIPFEPNFTIKYKENDILELPWDLSSTTFVFKAKINHRTEF